MLTFQHPTTPTRACERSRADEFWKECRVGLIFQGWFRWSGALSRSNFAPLLLTSQARCMPKHSPECISVQSQTVKAGNCRWWSSRGISKKRPIGHTGALLQMVIMWRKKKNVMTNTIVCYVSTPTRKKKVSILNHDYFNLSKLNRAIGFY